MKSLEDDLHANDEKIKEIDRLKSLHENNMIERDALVEKLLHENVEFMDRDKFYKKNYKESMMR